MLTYVKTSRNLSIGTNEPEKIERAHHKISYYFIRMGQWKRFQFNNCSIVHGAITTMAVEVAGVGELFNSLKIMA